MTMYFITFCFLFLLFILFRIGFAKLVSEYDQKIPQSQTAAKPQATWGRVTQQSRETRKTNKAKQRALSSPSR